MCEAAKRVEDGPDRKTGGGRAGAKPAGELRKIPARQLPRPPRLGDTYAVILNARCDAWNAPMSRHGIDARNPVCDHLLPHEGAFAGG
jgi:hypothetical protein